MNWEQREGASELSQDQGDPAPPPPPVHQQHVPAQVVNSSHPSNSVIMNEYNFPFGKYDTTCSPKWKNNEFNLDEYHVCQHSCRMIFDRPMAHISRGKVKTNVFLIWAGPNGQDLFDNFNLTAAQHHDIDSVMQ